MGRVGARGSNRTTHDPHDPPEATSFKRRPNPVSGAGKSGVSGEEFEMTQEPMMFRFLNVHLVHVLFEALQILESWKV